MNHSLNVLIQVAVVAGLGAHALWNPPVAMASDVGPVIVTGRPDSPAATRPGGEPTAAAIVSYRTAVARAAPSVVTIHSARTVSARLPFTPSVLVKGIASGVIVERDGYIVTNHHAVQGTSDLVVALADGSVYPTRVVGEDPDSDIALLKIDAEGLRPIAVADASRRRARAQRDDIRRGRQRGQKRFVAVPERVRDHGATLPARSWGSARGAGACPVRIALRSRNSSSDNRPDVRACVRKHAGGRFSFSRGERDWVGNG